MAIARAGLKKEELVVTPYIPAGGGGYVWSNEVTVTVREREPVRITEVRLSVNESSYYVGETMHARATVFFNREIRGGETVDLEVVLQANGETVASANPAVEAGHDRIDVLFSIKLTRPGVFTLRAGARIVRCGSR